MSPTEVLEAEPQLKGYLESRDKLKAFIGWWPRYANQRRNRVPRKTPRYKTQRRNHEGSSQPATSRRDINAKDSRQRKAMDGTDGDVSDASSWSESSAGNDNADDDDDDAEVVPTKRRRSDVNYNENSGDDSDDYGQGQGSDGDEFVAGDDEEEEELEDDLEEDDSLGEEDDAPVGNNPAPLAAARQNMEANVKDNDSNLAPLANDGSAVPDEEKSAPLAEVKFETIQTKTDILQTIKHGSHALQVLASDAKYTELLAEIEHSDLAAPLKLKKEIKRLTNAVLNLKALNTKLENETKDDIAKIENKVEDATSAVCRAKASVIKANASVALAELNEAEADRDLALKRRNYRDKVGALQRAITDVAQEEEVIANLEIEEAAAKEALELALANLAQAIVALSPKKTKAEIKHLVLDGKETMKMKAIRARNLLVNKKKGTVDELSSELTIMRGRIQEIKKKFNSKISRKISSEDDKLDKN